MTQSNPGLSAIRDADGTGSHVDREALRRTTIFRDLPDQVVEKALPFAALSTEPPNAQICRQGSHATHLHLLLDGQVTLSNTERNGASAVVEVVQPGGHFILTAVLARMPYLMDAHATTNATLITLEADGLLALLAQEPLLASALLRAEAMDFSAMVRQVCDLKMRTTAQRLGCYLLELTQDLADNAVTFRLPFDKRLLAAKLGCRQENLSRAFAALRGLGVETHGARVTLHDVARLRDYAFASSAAGAD